MATCRVLVFSFLLWNHRPHFCDWGEEKKEKVMIRKPLKVKQVCFLQMKPKVYKLYIYIFYLTVVSQLGIVHLPGRKQRCLRNISHLLAHQ